MKQPGFAAHAVYIATIAIKGLDGLVETVLGALIAITGPYKIYLAVLKITAPGMVYDADDSAAHHAARAVQHGAAGLAHTSPAFSVFYLLVHGVLKSFIAGSLLAGGRWIFPYACLILAAFAGFLGYDAVREGSPTVTALALFDLFTLLLVVKEWAFPYRKRG